MTRSLPSYIFGIEKEKSKVMYVALSIAPFLKVVLDTSTKFKLSRKRATTGFYDTKKTIMLPSIMVTWA